MTTIREPKSKAPYGEKIRPISSPRRRATHQVFDSDGVHPCNPEAEAITIGAVIDWPPNRELVELLEPRDFYKPEHETIWQAICDLVERGEAVTSVAVHALLSTRGELSAIGGQDYVRALTRRALELPGNARQYARIVFDRARDRSLMGIGAELAALAARATEDVDGILAYHRARLAEWEERALAFLPHGRGLPGHMASEVGERQIEWLWYHRVAYGMLALLDGDPGLGKGLIEAYLAARLSVGAPLPDDPDQRRRAPINVILISPEDDPEVTIKPRLVAAGADLSRVRIVTSVTDTQGRERAFTLPIDTPLLQRMIEEDQARFVVIDPIMACLDEDVETKNDQRVRGALLPLKQTIERTGAACLLVRHLNKTGNDKALYRGGGSIAFTGLARTTFLLAEHPDRPDDRVLAAVKSNLRKKAPSLAFAIVAPHEDADARIIWDKEPVAYDADALLGARKSTQRNDIISVLQANAAAGVADMAPHDIALALGYTTPDQEVNVRKLLRKMAAAGDVRQPSWGRYAL